MTSSKKADYGLDAPGVVRNLALVAATGLILFLSAAIGLWSGVVVGIPVAGLGVGFFVTCGTTAAVMVYGSKIGKVRGRDKLLDLLPWRGDEQVLDVGCGRGLLLIGAAMRLTTGKAVGVDIWQTEDLSGNRPDATLENAQLEGVGDRVEVRTANMRELPFPDSSFNTIVSSWAVHNLYDAKDREKALKEIARILKRGGRLLLRDIKHGHEYAAVLKASGLTDIRRADNRMLAVLATIWTFGGVRPFILVAEKGPGPA
jgi:ubiquinone/menaquinone biosynthesis C-methylase UbiE